MKTKLQPDEKVIYFGRKHWIVYIPTFFFSVVGATVFYFLVNKFLSVFVGLLVFLYFHIERKNNIWVVTNKRLIDEWGVVSINSKETPLDKVHNTAYNKDLLGMILNYGTVEIQSAAERGSTIAKFVPKPEQFCTAVNTAKEFEEERAVCPYCKEKIKKDAIKCKHCGSMLIQQNEIAQLQEVNKKEETSMAEQSVFKRKTI